MKRGLITARDSKHVRGSSCGGRWSGFRHGRISLCETLSFVSPSAPMATAFSPTHGEVALVNQIFAKHDPQKFGVITGDVAVNIFGATNLNATTLRQIWDIADSDNQGFLTRKGVSIAMRLVGWAQKGEAISAELINKRERDESPHLKLITHLGQSWPSRRH